MTGLFRLIYALSIYYYHNDDFYYHCLHLDQLETVPDYLCLVTEEIQAHTVPQELIPFSGLVRGRIRIPLWISLPPKYHTRCRLPGNHREQNKCWPPVDHGGVVEADGDADT